ncbi:hypothetical protein [uncultured Kordia sp.]|uniref:DUF6913 domain-containing protein n=1 Tax=uncultured Kordia sp. TaxID=507699 RepID=UPI00260CCFBB|nr:hypothetical protein [uncultured Kordia sp.]
MQYQFAYMFLKGLQHKSAKKVLTKKLNKTTTKEVSGQPIQTVGIIVNADVTEDFQHIAKSLQLNVAIDVMCYHKTFQKAREVKYPVFYEKDIGWKGKAKTTALAEFLDKPYDLLISYYSDDILPLQLASGLQKANFKIGIAGCSQEIHDVIIQTKENELKIFAKELHTYLHILNKLQ